MPTPNPDSESMEEFIDRCIPMVIDDGTAEDPEQAFAVCQSMWDNKGKSGKAKKAMEKSIAYSVIKDLKAIDDDERTFEGIASTPTPDRDADIVEPHGAKFTLPMPLLWQHDHRSPVGSVTSAKVTKAGIKIKGKIAKVDYPESLKNRLDEAWQSLKAELVRGLSIGFMPIGEPELLDTYGYRFSAWDWYELSLVTIPANAEASILNIKQYDKRSALSRKKGSRVSFLDSSKKIAVAKYSQGKTMNVSEQIKSFEASFAAKQAAMSELMKKASDEGRTLDEIEAAEFEGYQEEIDSINAHLKRLRVMEQMDIEKAVPVSGGNEKHASQARAGMRVSKTAEKLEKGIEFARFVMALGSCKGDIGGAMEFAKEHYPKTERIQSVLKYARKFGNTTSAFIKASVAGGTTSDATWAGPLLEYNQFAGDFVDYLRPMTIIGKFGMDNIPSLRRVPFNIHIRGQTSGGSGYWVGQGKPKPLTKFDFEDIYLGFAKVANIAVLTEELMRFSNPSAEALVRDQLAKALIDKLDTDFIDPSVAAVANVSPASITNAATPIVSSGTDADAVRADIHAAVSEFITANIGLMSGVWIMSAQTALTLSLMRNALGQREFPEMSMMGGMLEGLPVIASEYVPSDSSGSYMILANASDIWLADDGQVVVDASREASLQMLDNPTNDADTPTATTLVSMFQTNSIALRAERWINWKLRRDEAVSVISGVAYDSANSGA